MTLRLFSLLALCALLTGCMEAERLARDATRTAGTVAGAAGMVTTTEADWRMTASQYNDHTGRRYAFDCPPGGTFWTVWGSNPYTSDSGVCTAGVHAGAITREAGGRVLIEMRPGQDRYAARSQNGVSSNTYGSWGNSFVVLLP